MLIIPKAPKGPEWKIHNTQDVGRALQRILITGHSKSRKTQATVRTKTITRDRTVNDTGDRISRKGA